MFRSKGLGGEDQAVEKSLGWALRFCCEVNLQIGRVHARARTILQAAISAVASPGPGWKVHQSVIHERSSS